MIKTLLALSAAAALSAPAAARAQMVVTRDAVATGDALPFPMPGRQMKTGTGQIRGRVLAAETGAPIRRAQVRIASPDVVAKAALTDAEGRFEFRDLPGSRFTITASKSGFVNVQYGQTRPFESGRPIELADKQVLDNADIVMPRGSVIAGRIVDEFGEPMPDVAVTALRQTWSGGRRKLTPAPGRIAQTNDLGQFRLYGLPPGDYYVSATMRNAGAAEFMAIEMLAAGAAGGHGAGPTGSTPTSGYAPTYFPGTPSASDAQKVTLIAGQENQSVDFALVAVRLAKVTGIVVGSDGKPLSGAMINLAPASRGDFILNMGGSARTNQDGAFTLSSVAPGEYTLQANSLQVITSSEGGNTMVFRMSTGPGGDGGQEFGSLPLTVAGEDIPNLVLVTSKGSTATGRVIFEDGTKPPSANNIRITAMAADSEGPGLGFGGPGSGTLKPDGAFELKGLSGARIIRAVNLPPGWTLKSVRLNGVDVTDTGIDFKTGDAIAGLEVELTSRVTSVTGTATGSDGAALKDYTVVIFADNAELWRVPNTRWVAGRRPDQEGRFKFENLPPGTYHAVAVDYIPQGEWNDPEVLERLKSKGRRFTLGEGANETLTLKLVGDY
jgi:protocatechuate 3,4-dioxygenase beta subunit